MVYSLCLMTHLVVGSDRDLGFDWQFVRSQSQRLYRKTLGSSTDLEKNPAGLTTATQYSGAPLPLPMRVYAGFLVTGLSGKILIHTFPSRFIIRVRLTRAASI